VPTEAAKQSATDPDDPTSLFREAERLAERLTPLAMTGHPRQEGEDIMRASFQAIQDILERTADAVKGAVRLWLLGTNVD